MKTKKVNAITEDSKIRPDMIICNKSSCSRDKDNWIKIIDVKYSKQSIQDFISSWSIQNDNRPKSNGFAWVYDGRFCRKMSIEEIEENYIIINN